MIDSLKDLERLLKLCRKQGVLELKIRGCEFRLGDKPTETGTEITDETGKQAEQEILSQEDLMFYSAAPGEAAQ